MSNELMQLELTFQAFSRLVIDRLLAAKIATGKQISAPLKMQAEQMRDSGHYEAANHLDQLAAFSEKRANVLFLLEKKDDRSHQ